MISQHIQLLMQPKSNNMFNALEVLITVFKFVLLKMNVAGKLMFLGCVR